MVGAADLVRPLMGKFGLDRIGRPETAFVEQAGSTGAKTVGRRLVFRESQPAQSAIERIFR